MNNFKKFITDNGNVVYYKVDYEIGGYNNFTSTFIERGYYLHAQRQLHEYTAFRGLEHEAGSIMKLIKPVGRKNKKVEKTADLEAQKELLKLIQKAGI